MQDQYQSKNKSFNLSEVQAVLSQAGAVVDTDLLPIISKAEAGDFDSMSQLWDQFVDGSPLVKANYAMAKRYSDQLMMKAEETKEPTIILRSKTNQVHMLHIFEENFHVTEAAMIDTMKYMVNHVDFKDWNYEFVEYVQRVLGLRQEYYHDKW